jgi:hypothetical protein
MWLNNYIRNARTIFQSSTAYVHQSLTEFTDNTKELFKKFFNVMGPALWFVSEPYRSILHRPLSILLIPAVYFNLTPLVRFCLFLEADASQKINRKGDTLLHICSSPQIADILIQHKGKFNLNDQDLLTIEQRFQLIHSDLHPQFLYAVLEWNGGSPDNYYYLDAKQELLEELFSNPFILAVVKKYPGKVQDFIENNWANKFGRFGGRSYFESAALTPYLATLNVYLSIPILRDRLQAENWMGYGVSCVKHAKYENKTAVCLALLQLPEIFYFVMKKDIPYYPEYSDTQTKLNFAEEIKQFVGAFMAKIATLDDLSEPNDISSALGVLLNLVTLHDRETHGTPYDSSSSMHKFNHIFSMPAVRAALIAESSFYQNALSMIIRAAYRSGNAAVLHKIFQLPIKIYEESILNFYIEQALAFAAETGDIELLKRIHKIPGANALVFKHEIPTPFPSAEYVLLNKACQHGQKEFIFYFIKLLKEYDMSFDVESCNGAIWAVVFDQYNGAAGLLPKDLSLFKELIENPYMFGAAIKADLFGHRVRVQPYLNQTANNFVIELRKNKQENNEFDLNDVEQIEMAYYVLLNLIEQHQYTAEPPMLQFTSSLPLINTNNRLPDINFLLSFEKLKLRMTNEKITVTPENTAIFEDPDNMFAWLQLIGLAQKVMKIEALIKAAEKRALDVMQALLQIPGVANKAAGLNNEALLACCDLGFEAGVDLLLNNTHVIDTLNETPLNVINALSKHDTPIHKRILHKIIQQPGVFDYIEQHPQEFSGIISRVLAEFFAEVEKNRKDLTDITVKKYAFLILRHLIRTHSETVDNMPRFEQLFNLSELSDVLTYNENELIRLAIRLNKIPVAQVLLRNRDVVRLAETNNFYVDENSGRLDLRRFAADAGNSHTALSASESDNMDAARTYYASQIERLGGAMRVIEQYLQHLRAEYVKQPAQIMRGSRVIKLPLDLGEFARMKLSKAEFNTAMVEYFKNHTHTAYRFFLKPNPLIGTGYDQLGVKTEDGGMCTHFEFYAKDLAVLWLAASDPKEPELNGVNTEVRIREFDHGVARMTRSNNWSNNRLNPVTKRTEKYDDLERDVPVCFGGMPRQLFHLVVEHHLFVIKDLKMILDQEFNSFIYTHYKKILNSYTLEQLQELRTAIEKYFVDPSVDQSCIPADISLEDQQEFFARVQQECKVPAGNLYFENKFKRSFDKLQKERGSLFLALYDFLKFGDLINQRISELSAPPVAPVTAFRMVG